MAAHQFTEQLPHAPRQVGMVEGLQFAGVEEQVMLACKLASLMSVPPQLGQLRLPPERTAGGSVLRFCLRAR
ncbi:MAG: hypothetical protein HZB20_07755 [Chloroflexi bacterium]|nr:hypothetical protein [Chloroflexota bacterium]